MGLVWELLFKKYDVAISIDPHVLETHLAFFISKMRRKEFILWNDTWEWPRRPASKFLEPFVRFVIKRSDASLVVGNKQKDYLIKRGGNPNKIFLTPYSTLTYKPKKKIEKTGKNILYVGRLVPYKGVDILVRAFSKLEDKSLNLLIGGDGPFKEKIQELIRGLNLENVKFLGYATEEDKGDVYGAADVFVAPSTFRNYDGEAWGLVINEAMSSGLPIISTDAVGGAHDLIKDNGYMVKHGSVEELYLALEKILKNNELRRKMGENSKKIIREGFTYEKMVEGFDNALNLVFQGKR